MAAIVDTSKVAGMPLIDSNDAPSLGEHIETAKISSQDDEHEEMLDNATRMASADSRKAEDALQGPQMANKGFTEKDAFEGGAPSRPPSFSTAESPPLGSSANAGSAFLSTSDAAEKRLEALIEQQNSLLLRQLQLAEESNKNRATEIHHCNTPKELLKSLDPNVRGIFTQWRKDFHAQVQSYITQSRVTAEYQTALSHGNLIKPFCTEAQKPWEWPQSYRSVAKPIGEVDPTLPDGLSVGLADSDGNARNVSQVGENTNVYDIDAAFAELRRRHAWEMQSFVVAHHKVCLQMISEELDLQNQVSVLQRNLSAWVQEQANPYHCGHSMQHLEAKAKHFVELIHRQEMPKAEIQINEGVRPSFALTLLARLACLFAVVLAVTTLSHETLTRLFATLFALGCGMALIWEDLLMCSFRLVFGGTVQRLCLLGSKIERVSSAAPSVAHINLPTIIW